MTQLLVIAWQAIRSRPWASLGLVVTAAVGIASAGVAPLWANAAEDSLIKQAVREAEPGERVVTVLGGTDPTSGAEPAGLIAATIEETVVDASAMPESLARHFDEPRLLVHSAGRVALLKRSTNVSVFSPLAWEDGGCERLTLAAGRCPTGFTEIALSTRTARLLGIRLGQRVDIRDFVDEPPLLNPPGTRFPRLFRVVGLYRAPDEQAQAWAGTELFDFAPGLKTSRVEVPNSGDAAFVTRELMDNVLGTFLEVSVRRTLQLRSTEADAVDRVEGALSDWKAHLDGEVAKVDTAAPPLDMLEALHPSRDAIRLGSYLLGLQLWVLVAYVLFLLSTHAAEARQGDVALAKLRGLRFGKVVSLGTFEPLLLVVLAVPLGVVSAIAVTGWAVEALLTDVRLRVDGRFWLGALLATLATAGAATLALVRALRQPLGDQLRRAAPRTSLTKVVVGEVVAVSLAAAAFYEVATASEEARLDGIALLAPGLAAVAVAVVAARLLVAASSLWSVRTRARPSIRSFLAARQITRRRGGARVAVLSAVAVSLATFAVGTWEIAGQQRAAQAAMEVGAHRVYEVTAASPTRLLNSVELVDLGRGELVAAVHAPARGTTPPLLGVDAANVASAATWLDTWSDRSLAGLARELEPATPPSIELTGEQISIDMTGELFTDSGTAEGALVATVLDLDGRERPVSFGPIPFGRETLTAVAPECTTGCTLTRVRVVRFAETTGSLIGTVHFHDLQVDGVPVPGAFTDVAHWREAMVSDTSITFASASNVRAEDGVLVLAFNADFSELPGMERADIPKALPILAVGNPELNPLGHQGLVGSPVLGGPLEPAAVMARPDVMPRLGQFGIVADLEVLTRLSTTWPSTIEYEVWAGPGAPAPSVLRPALRAAGLTVIDVETLDGRTQELSEEGPALALLLLLGVAGAGLAVAALATVASALVQSRRRAYELAALRTAGVGDAALRGASLREYLVLLGAGSVCGFGSGIAAALEAGPSVGLLGITETPPPAALAVGVPLMSAVGLAVLVLFGVVAVACARISMRFSRPELLREAPA